MGQMVNTGASLTCSLGTSISTFKATAAPFVLVGGKTAGNITDLGSGINISPFGLCSSLANPAVAAATTAALGVLQPQPCTPQPTMWTLGSGSTNILIGGKPCLTQDCQCSCGFGGTISVADPGQMTVLTSM